MDKNIGVGLIIGLTVATSLIAYNSNKFSKAQKVFLLICIIFPPLQWVSMLILLGINRYRQVNSVEHIVNKKNQKETNDYDDNINSLRELKVKGILTDEEYEQKLKNLENSKSESQLKLSGEYKNLKSLYENGILTEKEFKSKVDFLKKKFTSETTFTSYDAENPLEFNVTEDLSEGCYVIMDEHMDYGFADYNYEKIIDTKYEYATSFKEGLALVRLDGKFGFIEKSGKVIIPFIYEDAESFENGIAKVKKGGESFYINKNGGNTNHNNV